MENLHNEIFALRSQVIDLEHKLREMQKERDMYRMKYMNASGKLRMMQPQEDNIFDFTMDYDKLKMMKKTAEAEKLKEVLSEEGASL